MSNLKKLSDITPKQIKSYGVQSLADKPNVSAQYGAGGLSPAQLKLWFDKLPEFLATRFNEIANALSSDEAGAYIRIPLDEQSIGTLAELINAMLDGTFANSVLKVFPSASDFYTITLQEAINGIAQFMSDTEETLESYQKTSGTSIEMKLDPTTYVLTLRLLGAENKELKVQTVELGNVVTAAEAAQKAASASAAAAATYAANAKKAEEEAKENIAEAEAAAVEHIESMAEQAFNVVQDKGQSETAVMSQKSATRYIDDQDDRITRNEKEIANLKAGLPDDTFYNDSAVEYVKDVPENALPYAEVVEVGGATRKCANLVAFSEKTVTLGGVSVTVQDSVITVSGTATSSGGRLTAISDQFSLNAGTYYFDARFSSFGMDAFIQDYATNSILAYNRNTFTLTEPKTCYFGMNVVNGQTYNQTVRVMLNAGETDLPYEPYFEGLRSAPVTEVESVGVNLFGGDALADKIVSTFSGTKNEADGTVSFLASNTGGKALFKDFKDNTVYTIIVSGRNSKGTSDANLGVAYTDNTTESLTFTDDLIIHTTKSGKTVRSLYGSYYDGTTVLEYNKCGIFEGVLTAEDFKPYTCHTLPIPAEVQALEGYGDSVDETYFNRVNLDGQKYTQCVKRIVFDGTEDWKPRTTTTSTGKNHFAVKVGAYGFLGANRCLCDRYNYAAITLSNMSDGVYALNSNSYKGAFINLRDSNFATVEEYKAQLATWYAEGNPLTVLVVVADPIITDISDILPADNLLAVEGGGTVRMVNEHGYDVPSAVVYQLENEVSA